MSRSLNRVTLIGNLGNDPEIRTTTGGNKVAQFSLATSRQWNSAAGEKLDGIALRADRMLARLEAVVTSAQEP